MTSFYQHNTKLIRVKGTQVCSKEGKLYGLILKICFSRTTCLIPNNLALELVAEGDIHANFPDLVGIFPILHAIPDFPIGIPNIPRNPDFVKIHPIYDNDPRFPTQIQNPALVLWA